MKIQNLSERIPVKFPLINIFREQYSKSSRSKQYSRQLHKEFIHITGTSCFSDSINGRIYIEKYTN